MDKVAEFLRMIIFVGLYIICSYFFFSEPLIEFSNIEFFETTDQVENVTYNLLTYHNLENINITTEYFLLIAILVLQVGITTTINFVQIYKEKAFHWAVWLQTIAILLSLLLLNYLYLRVHNELASTYFFALTAEFSSEDPIGYSFVYFNTFWFILIASSLLYISCLYVNKSLQPTEYVNDDSVRITTNYLNGLLIASFVTILFQVDDFLGNGTYPHWVTVIQIFTISLFFLHIHHHQYFPVGFRILEDYRILSISFIIIFGIFGIFDFIGFSSGNDATSTIFGGMGIALLLLSLYYFRAMQPIFDAKVDMVETGQLLYPPDNTNKSKQNQVIR